MPIVFDPVMIATSGSVLADEATVAAFARLMRLATLVTPNLPELAALSPPPPPVRPEPVGPKAGEAQRLLFFPTVDKKDRASTSSARTDAEDAIALAQATGAIILVKGGHGDGDILTDRLIAPDGEIARWSGKRIDTPHNHGTGCTLASAIATGLGEGRDLNEAVARAIRFVRIALLSAPGLGQGHGPMGHSFGTCPFDEIEG